MKVDLIQKSSEFDTETLVVAHGFDESGFADIQHVRAVSIQLSKSESSRETIGEYEDASRGTIINAVFVDHSR